MNRSSCTLMVALVVALIGTSPASAQTEVYVPAELEPWRGWVLHGEEHRACPFVFNLAVGEEQNHVCAWPGTLLLTAGPDSGSFEQSWRIYRDSWIELPGDPEHWPQDVRANGRAVPVVQRNGSPGVLLAVGEYRLVGRFLWAQRPEQLTIPLATGLLDLRVDGTAVSRPDRRANRVWLGERREEVEEQEQISVQVYRKLADGVPMELTTRVRLDVSGRAREEVLAGALPAGFVPMALATGIPARLEADGALRVQVRPGKWRITLTGRAGKPAEQFRLEPAPAPWPEEEVWSYAPAERLRVSSAEGAQSVDASQANVPAEWRSLPAFRMRPGDALRIVERSRGISQQEGNQLDLTRELWLDFDRGGMTAQDRITGRMRRGWRLQVGHPYRLVNATTNGENLLITDDSKGRQTGIELRAPAVNLFAVSRIEGRARSLPATGWEQRFNSVRTTLHLPPGYRLLGATGADQSREAWVKRWRLLDLFLVLVIAVAVAKLLSRYMGVLTLIMLVLIFHETGAPTWSWLNLLIGLSLAAVAPEGRLKRAATGYRNLSFAVLVLIAVPFIAAQARMAIFPQLETTPLLQRHLPAVSMMVPAAPPYATEDQAVFGQAAGVVSEEEPQDMPAAVERFAGDRAVVSRKERVVVSAQRVAAPRVQRYAPDALLQTGPGLPAWRWRSHALAWSGPVESSQQLTLTIAPPLLVALWRIAGIVLLVIVLLALSRRCFGWPRKPAAPLPPAASAVLVLALLMPYPADAQLDTPDPALLDELRDRLTKAPECAGQCAEFARARLVTSPARLVIQADLHAMENVAVPLPGSLETWEPRSVSVDGQSRQLLYRDSDGTLWLKLDAGRHSVELRGPLPGLDSVQIPFPQRPHYVGLSGDGWDVSGLEAHRMLTGSLELVRRTTNAVAESEGEPVPAERFPVFVEVWRHIRLDLDWYAETAVRRRAPASGALTAEIPLLGGESVLSSGVEVRDGNVVVALNAGQGSFRWQSALSRETGLALSAPDSEAWAEIWSIAASPTWHVEYNGVPAVFPQNIDPNLWVPEFHPLPGESLRVSVSRPRASEGATLAVDRAVLGSNVGRRSSESTLQLQYRSTQGGQHGIALPPDAEVIEVLSDNSPLGVRPEQGILRIPLMPGRHDFSVRWRSPTGVRWARSSPAVDLGVASSNVNVNLAVPHDRWILLARGPSLGPAVLYWAELLVFMIVAAALGRTRQTPLRTHHWLLLGLGFSTFSWLVLALVVAWLFVLAWRKSTDTAKSRRVFNLQQILLGAWSVAVLGALVSAIPSGLLGTPDMHILGHGSQGNSLSWFQDQTASLLPRPVVFSVPIWIYKAAMLLWALWLSFALVRWLPWAWRCYTAHGLWRGKLVETQAAATDTES